MSRHILSSLFLALLAAVFGAGCGSSGITGPQEARSMDGVPDAIPPQATPSDEPPAGGPGGDGDDPAPARIRSKLRKGGVLDLTFDDLEFDIEPDEDFERPMLTPDIESYDGKTVILRGFIFDGSIFSRTGIREFVLVRDNQVCCFGPGAKVFHNTMVELAPGKSTEFTFRPVEVEGTFSIRPWVNPGDGKTYSVFHILANSVR